MHALKSCAALLCLLPLWVQASPGGGVVTPFRGQPVSMAANSPVRISVDFPFTEGPLYGHVPFVVNIHNNMGKAGDWALRAQTEAGSYGNMKTTDSGYLLSVPDRQIQSFKLSAPIARFDENNRHYRERNLSVHFSGPHTQPYSSTYHTIAQYSGGSGDNVAILLSPTIHRAHSPSIRSVYDRRGHTPVVATYDLEIIPQDWRCYIGFDLMLFSEDDWLSVDKAARDSIMNAVATGEVQLRFVGKSAALSPELTKQLGVPADASVWAHGLGVIARYPELNDKFLNEAEQKGPRSGTALDLQKPALSTVGRDASLAGYATADDPKSFDNSIIKEPNSGGLISIVIVVFALLVGPINLFVFAKGRKRLRIFITTPLIAGAATILLFISILLADGIGGEGRIARLIFLLPESNQAYVRQEQTSVTGLFFDGSFEVEGKDWMHFHGAALSTQGRAEEEGDFNYMNGRYSGDWFASKRVQRHALQTYLTARESIDLIQEGDKPPQFFSNFRGVCDEIYYLDEEAVAWRASDLRLGGRQVLEQVELDVLADWYGKQCLAAGTNLAAQLGQFGIRRGHYYATVRDWQQTGLQTVEGIDWQIHSQLLIGQPETGRKGGLTE